MPYGFAAQSIAVVLGTRPEIIKLSHIIKLLGDAVYLVHTGQHYDPTLSDRFFDELGLPRPDVFLRVGGKTRGAQIARALTGLDELAGELEPKALIVQGDTNSVVAGALAANARQVFLCHIEAGLRSYDRTMPEEHNRVLTDHLADLCCAPTDLAVSNLTHEGIPSLRVVKTGNTIVEVVLDLLPPPQERQQLVTEQGLVPGEYVLATFHRPENVDDPASLRTILEELAGLPVPVLLPLHPRSAANAARHHLADLLKRVSVTEPLPYRLFLALQAEAALIISDSGGIAEEASIVKRPLLVVRRSTERPEVMGTFATRVKERSEIGARARRLLNQEWDHLQSIATPFGDGSASDRSIAALAERLD